MTMTMKSSHFIGKTLQVHRKTACASSWKQQFSQQFTASSHYVWNKGGSNSHHGITMYCSGHMILCKRLAAVFLSDTPACSTIHTFFMDQEPWKCFCFFHARGCQRVWCFFQGFCLTQPLLYHLDFSKGAKPSVLKSQNSMHSPQQEHTAISNFSTAPKAGFPSFPSFSVSRTKVSLRGSWLKSSISLVHCGKGSRLALEPVGPNVV